MIDQTGYWALVAVGFGFLIFVHELGHFVAAKAVGIRIIRFALGFGPRLFGKKIGETDYCVCLIPCGGYVKMAGGEGAEETTGAPDEFPSKTPGQRALVVAAGPFMSVIAAVPMLFMVFLFGMERPSARINHVAPGTPAWETGLKRGDLITGLKQSDEQSWQRIRLWRDLLLNAPLQYKVGEIDVRVGRNGKELEFSLKTRADGTSGFGSRVVGSESGYVSTVVGHVPAGGPAARAGLAPGARILAIAGHKVSEWDDIEASLHAQAGKTVEIQFMSPDGSARTGSLSLEALPLNGIKRVTAGSPAAQAEIKPGDIIAAVNGHSTSNWLEIEQAIRAAGSDEIEVSVLHVTDPDSQSGELKEHRFQVTPDDASDVGEMLGIEPELSPSSLGIVANRPNRIKLVRPDFPAAKAGVKPWDRVTAVNGSPTNNWPQIEQAVRAAGRGKITLSILRSAEPGSSEGASTEHTIELTPEDGTDIGDTLGIAGELYPVVEGFVPGSDAEQAGIKIGAKLVTARAHGSRRAASSLMGHDGVQFLRWTSNSRKVDIGFVDDPALQFALEQRDNEVDTDEGQPPGVKYAVVCFVQMQVGVLDASPRLDKCRMVEPGRPLAALKQACVETVQWIERAGRSLWMLVRGRMSPKLLSGPVLILTISRYQAEAGWMKFVEFMVIITVHLGVINLVPFPILDGGHLGFLVIEKVRRKPLSDSVMARLMYTGMVCLIALMLFVTWNDLAKLLGLG